MEQGGHRCGECLAVGPEGCEFRWGLVGFSVYDEEFLFVGDHEAW